MKMGFCSTFFTAIAFCLVSILAKTFGELIVLRHPLGDNNYERKLTCLAEDDDSALIWNYNPTEEQLKNGNNLTAFEPKRPTPRHITGCAVWGPGENCLAGWKEENAWYAVNSTTKPMAPVLDHRWEGFTEFAFDKAMKEQNYLSVGKVDNSSGTVVFSVRGSYHTHVFLCKSNELTKGPCIWIALSRGPHMNPGIRFCADGVPHPNQIPLRGNCIDLATSQNESSEYLDAYEWRTFILKWDSTEKSIKIFTHDNSEPFLSATNSTWVDVPYIFVIGERPSRIRFHFYEYFLAERKDTELCTKKLKNYRKIVRFKLLVGLCRDCELIIILEDNMSREIYKKIVKNEISVTNELLAWRPVELTPNLGNLTSRQVRLVIRTVLPNGNEKGRWAIDSFRTYETNGGTRKSTLTIGRAEVGTGCYQPSWSLVKCQKLSYRNGTVVDPFSTAKFRDKIRLREFLRGRKGPYEPECTNFGPDWLICDQTGCTCDRGFEGLACNTSCSNGYYGYDCEEMCESCNNHICNPVTGYCGKGCKDSKLQPPLCKTELRIQDPFVTDITDTAATLFQPLEFDRGVNFTVGLEITNMESNTTRIVRPVTAESKSIFEVGIKLDLNTRYKLRTVVRATIGQWSREVNSNEIFFTSTCMGLHRFQVLPGENNVTVTQFSRNMMCGDLENPIKSVTVSQRTGEKISCRHVIRRGSYICSELLLHNEYEIQIVASDSTFWMMRFRTLGSAPDKPSILIPSPKGTITLTDVEPNLIWLISFPIIAICLLALFIWHRKYKKSQNQREDIVPLSLTITNTGTSRVPHIPQPSTTLPKATEDRISMQQSTPDVVPYNSHSYSVKFEEFEEYTREAIASGLLGSQYEAMATGLTKACEYGKMPENLFKNRYKNLLPYDDTRVILEKIHGDPHSDYINASYIKGYRKERAYIATQGPLPNTVNDFWRMVWQEKVNVICMLTNVTENGKTKCEEYWPMVGTGIKYGNIHVSNTDHEVFADYTIRTLNLSYENKDRKITHLHYTGWPDHGVPMYSQSLVAYLKKLLATPTGNGPVVVHCSAGIGRTGTIILCEICLRQAVRERTLDVPSVTVRMREDRSDMVNSVQQYMLAHLAIMESMVYEQTQVPCSDSLPAKIKELRKHLPFDIQRLTDSVWQDRALHSFAVTRYSALGDVATNGLSEFIPATPTVPEFNRDSIFDSVSNYINAVSVDGVKMKKQYLESQLPSPLTLSEYWRLIAEKKIELILILQMPSPNDPMCCEIMSNDSILIPVPYIQVEVKSSVDEKEHFTIQRLLMTDKSGKKRKQPVTVLKCTGWKSGKDGQPPSPEALVSLWMASEKISRKNAPTLVLCHDGVTGCGLYLALSFLLERMAVERECDVISAVRAVRRSRTEFVQSLVQFDYLYDAAVNFFECFHTYANFS